MIFFASIKKFFIKIVVGQEKDTYILYVKKKLKNFLKKFKKSVDKLSEMCYIIKAVGNDGKKITEKCKKVLTEYACCGIIKLRPVSGWYRTLKII